MKLGIGLKIALVLSAVLCLALAMPSRNAQLGTGEFNVILHVSLNTGIIH